MIYIVTGQTATGKTAYAIKLAKEHDGELINADSRQIYKKLNIITGKDLQITQGDFTVRTSVHGQDIGYYPLKNGSKIWLYDILDPHQPFSAFEYVTLVSNVIEDIQERGKTPIIVGGTFFYIQQLLQGASDFRVEPDPQLRKDLALKPVEELQKLLEKRNKQLFISLNNSEKHNPQRLIRRIEIETHAADQPSEHTNYAWHENDFSLIGLRFEEKEDLRIKIANRVEERLAAGALAEVEDLLANGYRADNPGLKTIGYMQIIEYINGQIDYETMKERWITKEVQYAKRQVTLMKKNQHIRWEIV